MSSKESEWVGVVGEWVVSEWVVVSVWVSKCVKWSRKLLLRAEVQADTDPLMLGGMTPVRVGSGGGECVKIVRATSVPA